MKLPPHKPATLVFAILLCQPNQLYATEGGGTSYPLGVGNYMSGAIPPPGIYAQLFTNHYESNNLRKNDGRKLPIDFRVQANALIPQAIWVSNYTLLGGRFAFQALAPLVDIRAQINGRKQHTRDLGDIIFGPALGFHHSEKLHSTVAFDVVAPTGRYDKNDIANPGRNYWDFVPVYAISHVDPSGLNLDARAAYSFNRENPDTNYRSGRELNIDYAVGWGFSNGWVAGLGGYLYRQITDDRQNGERIVDNKGRSFSVGPSIMYSKDGWLFSAKWSRETEVRNRAQGDTYWIRLFLPF